ncbi:NAD(P)H-dependent oxidoreductase [Alteromonas sp. KUL49]|uniref:FMN-dependent NADH-azoreductase n=1 Tax=Alteromonas sp. KUL49 TaxID=2480798 RepID=UPI00102EFC58|nr:NAD(P)H-dependent oxidoreductase [Alteromonas sp. KUL49]TAP41497.1 FMN-dependent NADH-azoreductase [Alteromonas sp. KUL49]GEA10588.1 FMN-dependent NADH-azoreductase [Alteromonas sp. KUL49]
MSNILLIKSSLNGEQSKSNTLANQLAEQFTTLQNANVITRDIAAEPLSHLSQAEIGAWMTPEADRSQAQVELVNVSDTLINEVQNSDTLIVAIPMYNFGVPSTFKAWADRIARAGITFKYTETGPLGLLENKRVIVVATRGGMYQGTEKDSQTQFLKDFFAFIGLTNIQFVYAEGLNMPNGEQSFSEAQAKLEQVVNA